MIRDIFNLQNPWRRDRNYSFPLFSRDIEPVLQECRDKGKTENNCFLMKFSGWKIRGFSLKNSTI